MANPVVKVSGIREAARAFRKVDKDIPKQLRTEFLPIARDVVSGIQSKAPRGKTGRARASVKPRSSQRGAAVAVGGNAAPYYPWLDFGGSTGKGHKPGRPWSGSVKREMPPKGRYLYPTIEEQRAKIERAAEDAVVNVARLNGFGVR